jgi:hypothetical protein
MFQRAHGKLYLVSFEFIAQMDSVWKDKWLMSQLLVVLEEMKSPSAPKPLTRSECRLADVLTAPRGTLQLVASSRRRSGWARASR